MSASCLSGSAFEGKGFEGPKHSVPADGAWLALAAAVSLLPPPPRTKPRLAQGRQAVRIEVSKLLYGFICVLVSARFISTGQ